MKPGDLVRFAKWEELTAEEIQHSNRWHMAPKPHIGVLVEHDRLMGSVKILHEGTIISARPMFVEKAGRKDFENR